MEVWGYERGIFRFFFFFLILCFCSGNWLSLLKEDRNLNNIYVLWNTFPTIILLHLHHDPGNLAGKEFSLLPHTPPFSRQETGSERWCGWKGRVTLESECLYAGAMVDTLTRSSGSGRKRARGGNRSQPPREWCWALLLCKVCSRCPLCWDPSPCLLVGLLLILQSPTYISL